MAEPVNSVDAASSPDQADGEQTFDSAVSKAVEQIGLGLILPKLLETFQDIQDDS